MEFRCVNAKGDDAGDCDKFAKYYRSLCPGEWVSAFSFAASIVNYSPGECILLSKEHTDDKLDLTPQFFSLFWARNHEIIIMLQWMYCYAVCDLSNYIKVLAVNNLLFNTKTSFNYVPLVRVAFVQYPDSVSGLLSTDSSCDGLMAFNNILAPAFSVTAFSCQLVGRTYGR